ncbi:unnamed protein product [Caenorhabditis angaria]|uniref:Homeobox domain-containing protein n=1 Tax=Caenorhabditis angaria TaxID=860376 RepID=A0A9P1IZK5_9PELO|nr:unnamed protein product [Caenorhabditis angaria]
MNNMGSSSQQSDPLYDLPVPQYFQNPNPNPHPNPNPNLFPLPLQLPIPMPLPMPNPNPNPPISYQNLVFVPPFIPQLEDGIAPNRRWSYESGAPAQAGEEEGGEKGGASAASGGGITIKKEDEGTLSDYHNLGASANHLHMSNIGQQQQQQPQQQIENHLIVGQDFHHQEQHLQHIQQNNQHLIQHQQNLVQHQQIVDQQVPQLPHQHPHPHPYRDNDLFDNDYFVTHNVRSVSAPSIGNNGYVANAQRGLDFGARRRFRTNFTEQQSLFLEDSFRDSHYPDHKSKKDMATLLNIPEDRITVWFQNRRAKWRRKELRDKERSRSDNCAGPSCSFDYSCYASSSSDSAFLPPDNFPVLENNYDNNEQYQDLKPENIPGPYSISNQ